MAVKFLIVTLFFALVVILPVNHHYQKGPKAKVTSSTYSPRPNPLEGWNSDRQLPGDVSVHYKSGEIEYPDNLLWMFVVFTYLFTAVAMYLLVAETRKIINTRQQYLGSQTTVTDRTIRLSGIPPELRDEKKITETIEKLEIGKVESVILCRNWKELDDLFEQRMVFLRKLEEAWTAHLGYTKLFARRASRQRAQSRSPDHEQAPLLQDEEPNEQSNGASEGQERPKTRVWYGFLGLQSRQVDAIDYFEERLRRLDEKIDAARKTEYKPTPLAFVTLDSVAACQMAVQATVDPEPMQLLANPAPAPSDVVWQNTYLSRWSRIARSWSITLVILVLTVFWSAILVPIAALVSLKSICTLSPQFAFTLDSNPISQSLIVTGLPTALISLLTVLVPFLYYWLSTLQGMLSQGEIEISLINKNFFFTFFNLFVLFTVFGTASEAVSWVRINDTLAGASKDVGEIARKLATSLQDLDHFYLNLIILQALGLFPFRLLEFGSVSLYPIYLIGSKTPRGISRALRTNTHLSYLPFFRLR